MALKKSKWVFRGNCSMSMYVFIVFFSRYFFCGLPDPFNIVTGR